MRERSKQKMFGRRTTHAHHIAVYVKYTDSLKEDENKNEEVSCFSSENAKESISMRKPVQKSHTPFSTAYAPEPNRAPGDLCTVNPMMTKDSDDERVSKPG